MDPTRCEGGCGRWIHHPKRAKVARRKFCATCANPGKRLVHEEPPPPKVPPDRSAYYREWAQANRERRAEYHRVWQEQNREKTREYARKHRRKRKNLDMR